jgi:hypothetical protein
VRVTAQRRSPASLARDPGYTEGCSKSNFAYTYGMQALRRLAAVLDELASAECYLFSPSDLRAAMPDMPSQRFKELLSRAAKNGVLGRVCRGIYLVPRLARAPGLILPHTAAKLRVGHLLYLSLESALSEHGVISQVLLDRLTLMTSGRRGLIDCGEFGSIEFTHTQRSAQDCRGQLSYDDSKRLWVASASLAWQDLRRVGRNLDLVDPHVLEEIDS